MIARGTRWLLLTSALMSCAVGPDFVRPKAPPVDRYTNESLPAETVAGNNQIQRFVMNGAVAPDWWRLFNAGALNQIMSEALAHNQNLEAAQASLRRNENNLRAGYGIFFPFLDLRATAGRERFSTAQFGGSFGRTSIFNLYTLQGLVSYPLDIFGGERRQIENLKAQVDYQRYVAAATYLTLCANVANTVIARAGYREQLAATESLLTLEREQLRITSAQVQAGIVPETNLLTLQSQFAGTEATVPPLQQRVDQAEHLLASLAGRTPGEWQPPEVALDALTLPGELPVSLPSELVHQRPDILQAEATLHSTSAQIGVATAALLPSFSLSGDYGFTSTQLSQLFDGPSVIWSYGAGLVAPLFHGGQLWFQRKAAIEAYQAALATYRQTVLDAFVQVADTLRGLQHDAEAVRATTDQVAAASKSLQLIQANYRAGTVNYLQVLVANLQFHQAKLGQIQAQALRLQDTVALFVALGGSWEKVELKAAEPVAH